MKLIFVGDPSGASNPDVCHMYGYEFPIGKPVDVSNELIAAKLARNSHFELDGGQATQKRRRRSKPVEAGLELGVSDDHAHSE